MIKNLAWNTFKNTGDVNTYLELSKVIDIEKNKIKAEAYGNSKNEGDNNTREYLK